MNLFDPELLRRWEDLGPAGTYREARELLYRNGMSSSEEMHEAFEDLVERGLLSWDLIDGFEQS